MKKNLTLLTGIVFLITILAAGGCGDRKKQTDSTTAGNDPQAVADDSPKVDIFLKDTLMRGSMHLFMSDSRKPDCGVIDNLQTEVFPGDTVIFKKAKQSRVDEVIDIRLEKEDVTIFNKGDRGSYLYLLVIDSLTPTDTIVKYEIVFTVKQDTTTYKIDPYLRIPPGP